MFKWKKKRKKRKPHLTPKERRLKRHQQHVIFYGLLIFLIFVVQLFMPTALDSLFGSVIALSNKIKLLATEGTAGILALAGLIYAWKQLTR